MDGELFILCAISVCIIGFFYNLGISNGLGIFMGLVISYYLINWIAQREQIQTKQEEEIYKDKISSIKPDLVGVSSLEISSPNSIINTYPEFVNYLFSIQEFYSISPPNYESMVDNIANLLELYEESISNNQTGANNYPLAKEARSNALNYLSTIIFRLPSDKDNYYLEKLNMAREQLDVLLTNLVQEIYEANNNYIKTYGFNRQTQIIDHITEPEPASQVEDPDYSWGIY